jgi:D-tyrosyl-tRNA(Tyr) deacylase
MRAVIQRVSSASLSVGAEEIFSMAEGLVALVGVGTEDAPADATDLARRIVHLRIFEDENERMNRSLIDVGGTLAVVSQFTLFGDARKGRRPSYARAAPAELAAPLVDAVADAAREQGVTVVTGRFQARMEVALVNTGPVTILLDTERSF